jgi:hypothetical protein
MCAVCHAPINGEFRDARLLETPRDHQHAPSSSNMLRAEPTIWPLRQQP